MLLPPKLHGTSIEEKRKEIKEYFNSVFMRYESLFKLLSSSKVYYQKPESLRHPLIFYYGHTATFFINKLKLAKIITKRINPQLESIFAVGVDEMSWDDLDEEHYKWPSIEETQEYRDSVYLLINTLIDRLPMVLPITQTSPWWIILMGIEHENIHIETSSVLIRQLPLESVQESTDWEHCLVTSLAPQNTLLNVEEGSVALGKNKDESYYGWDNEYGSHQAIVPAFKASQYLVSNGEYLSFVKDGGYTKDIYWDNEGLEWRNLSKATEPSFWIENNEEYKLRILTQEIDLPMNWPAEVNYHEAHAFCNWLSSHKGITLTLPTEDEYMRLLAVSKIEEANNNLQKYASSTPIDMYSHGDFFDVVGNVWQWTRTAIYPYDGFEVHPIYDDFTVPTYDGKHNLIKGGSWASCGNVASTQSRYAFRRHFFQHAGFRYVQSNYKEQIDSNSYESDKLIAQYCHFGWGESYFGVENYSKECANIALELTAHLPQKRALDIGCAIGRSSFELAKGFDKVIGIDFSARFIRHAQFLKQSGVLRYAMPTQGDLEEYFEVDIRTLDLYDVRNKVEFWQGDACNLKEIHQDFDLVFASNLIDRLYDPKKFLDSLASRLNKNALLILTSPYTWQEESTPKERWLGGFKKNGENFDTLEGLEEILEPHFRLKETRDIPFVIRETARKFQHSVAQMSIWELK